MYTDLLIRERCCSDVKAKAASETENDVTNTNYMAERLSACRDDSLQAAAATQPTIISNIRLHQLSNVKPTSCMHCISSPQTGNCQSSLTRARATSHKPRLLIIANRHRATFAQRINLSGSRFRRTHFRPVT